MSSENKKRETDVVYDLQKLNSIDTVDLIEKLISDKVNISFIFAYLTNLCNIVQKVLNLSLF